MSRLTVFIVAVKRWPNNNEPLSTRLAWLGLSQFAKPPVMLSQRCANASMVYTTHLCTVVPCVAIAGDHSAGVVAVGSTGAGPPVRGTLGTVLARNARATWFCGGAMRKCGVTRIQEWKQGRRLAQWRAHASMTLGTGACRIDVKWLLFCIMTPRVCGGQDRIPVRELHVHRKMSTFLPLFLLLPVLLLRTCVAYPLHGFDAGRGG